MKRPLQALLMSPEWHNDCETKVKLSTVREGHRDYQMGPCVLCCHIKSWCMDVQIVDVIHCKLKDVDEDIAIKEGFKNKEFLFKKLKEYYPDIGWESDVTIIHWI